MSRRSCAVKVAVLVIACMILLGSCSLSDPSTSTPGDIPRCTSGDMRCRGNSLWACNAQRYWVQIQDCTKTGQSCYQNNPGRCGSNRPCCAG